MRRRIWLLALVFMAGACATDINDPNFQRINTELLNNQLTAVVANSRYENTKGKVFYIGLALWTENWSENDVLTVSQSLKDLFGDSFDAVILSNKVTKLPATYPISDVRTASTAIKRVSKIADKADDTIFILVSGHGNKDMLISKIGYNKPKAIPVWLFKSILKPLVDHRAVIIISACHSGSLIDDLENDNWIIITATDEDHVSFGCGPMERNTYFVNAINNSIEKEKNNFRDIFSLAKENIKIKEKRLNFENSNPQMFVGMNMIDYAKKPLE